MAKPNNPFIVVSKGRFSRIKLRLDDQATYLIGEDNDADIKLNGVKASIYKDQQRWILMNIEGENLRVNRKIMSSVELRENLDISLGGYSLQYSSGERLRPSDTQSNPLRIMLLAGLVFFVVIFLFSGDDESGPAPENATATLSETSEQETKQMSTETHTLSSVNSELMNPLAFQHYNEALNTYDGGDIKQALVKMLEAASIDPQNQLIQNKIVDWESKINAEISRLYNQACFDLEYFRVYEAEALFRIIVELNVDKSDIRFLESQRILDELHQKSNQNLNCGG